MKSLIWGNFSNHIQSERYLCPEEFKTQFPTDYPETVRSKKVDYYNIACAFDTESSSFFSGQTEKTACVYAWTVGINGVVCFGRTWDEFISLCDFLVERLGLCGNRRLVIYVHNLSHEFQWIRRRFSWHKVFAISERKPVYAITETGLEFRCSYLLSGYSLAKLSDQLLKYRVKKLVGELDYRLVRHSETVMTDNEIAYCVNDARVVMAYIQELIEREGSLVKIPLTKTGFVRRFVRESCFAEGVRWKYRQLMSYLTLCGDEYRQLKRAFQGGFTHANPFWSGKVVENVESWDFTSSYPAAMVSERYPMSRAEYLGAVSKDVFEHSISLYCCVFDVEFIGLRSALWQDSYISRSRCAVAEKPVLNNGRVVCAERLVTTLTDVDFGIIRKFYQWDCMRVGNFRRYRRGYLPTVFVEAVLKLYGDKTRLKGVAGKEAEYLQAKEMLNSCYGMLVTDIVRDSHYYDTDWVTESVADLEKAVADNNKSFGRFGFYAWGVFVTAYARRNLFTAIIELGGNDYIYSDTDSVKCRNAETHRAYFERYNEWVTKRLENALDYHHIPHEAIRPRTIKGVEKPLGVWDFDGSYSRFKTLGAKRYMVEYANDIRNAPEQIGKVNITVSGLNKSVCVPWLISRYGEDIFDGFSDNLDVPPDHTGKLTHTYIDTARRGYVTDYQGRRGRYNELSAVHLEPAPYSLKLSREYIDYVASLRGALE